MDPFLKACGAAGPLRLMVEKRGLPGAVSRSFPQPSVLIGRDPRTDLFLDHPRVGRRHAYLQMVAGGIFCVDLDSRTGTRWEDGTARAGWLTRPQGIGIGPFVIQPMTDGPGRAEARDPLETRSGDLDDLPRAILEFPRQSSRLPRWRMNCLLALVGNSPRCKVQLIDPSVSRFHCSLVRTPEGIWVVDLLGREGITVNGASVRAAHLEDGDELKVGEILIRVVYESPAPRARAPESAPGVASDRTTTLVVPEMTSSELVPRSWEVAWPPPGLESRGTIVAGPSGGSELSETALAMVLNQFGQMQQQMLDQFQQSTMMMFQMFGSMHAEQMETIREELKRLREIGESLESLKAEVKAAADRSARPPLGPAPWSRPSPVLPVESPPRAEVSGPGAGARRDIPAPKTPAGAEAGTANGSGPHPSPGEMAGDRRMGPSPNVDEWLMERISALQDEQHSRWQKIFNLVRKK